MIRLIATILIAAAAGVYAGGTEPPRHGHHALAGIGHVAARVADAIPKLDPVRVDSLREGEASERYSHLTEEDFRLVAEELGVEVAAIKAVVEIEAGKNMKGFWAPGVPVINFEPSMFRRYSRKHSGSGAKGEKVPAGLTNYARSEWTQLVNARRKNVDAANLSTFWGMFQIGGFNYKLCGCSSIAEFVRLMSYSELEQLELFAAMVKNTGMLRFLRARDWAGFSARYNGPSYRRRGYHTRMAAAYKRYKGKTD